MRPFEVLLFYVLIGLGVGWMAWRSGRAPVWAAVPFWPLFLPVDLHEVAPAPPAETSPVGGALQRLRAALTGWDPLPTGGNAALAAAERGLTALARRRAEVDLLLAQPGNDLAAAHAALAACTDADRPIYEARVRNLERLHAVQEASRADLARALAGVEDLTTRVHLARLRGDSTDDVARQLGDLAAAIDGVGEVRSLGQGVGGRGVGRVTT